MQYSCCSLLLGMIQAHIYTGAIDRSLPVVCQDELMEKYGMSGLWIAAAAVAVVAISAAAPETRPDDGAFLGLHALCVVAFHAGIALIIHAVSARRRHP